MVILASTSPRRRELLAKVTPIFKIEAPDVDEKSIEGLYPPMELPAQESILKAASVYKDNMGDEVIACDTIVLLEGEVLGKPKDEEDAVRMLLKESGKRQTVVSGYTYMREGLTITRTVTSEVYFNELSESFIREYVKKYQPLDKAGAYGIQDRAGLIDRIEGSYDNVMGLPTEDIIEHVYSKMRR